MAEESHNGEGSRLKARCAGSWSQRYARLPESCAPPSAGCPVLQHCVADAFSLLVCATAAKSISGGAVGSIPPAGRYAIFGQLVIPPPASYLLSPSVPPLAVQAESQKLAFPGPPYPALGGIQLQSQMSACGSRRLRNPSSPLLANIYLDALDRELERRGRGPPCGVPSTLSSTTPATMIPALRYLPISFHTRLSRITSAIFPIRMSPWTRSQNLAMRHARKRVPIHDPVLASSGIPLRGSHRILRASPRPESIAVLAESRLPDRRHRLQQHLLDEPIQYRRDP